MANSTAATHQVFVGFSRKDIGNSFVSHLDAAFRRIGISAFVDYDGGLGSEAAAIEGSTVSVVVFSENYASSVTCLNALVKILECRRNGGQSVIPVFYGISRLFVAQQKGRFKMAFADHEKSGDFASLVSTWREALEETAGLDGHEQNDKQSDPELVGEIVRDVHDKLFVTGMNSRLLKIENLLCKQSGGIHSIGICGMPGVGKTTIAQAAFYQMSGDYEASYFLRDFDQTFCKRGLNRLREDYLAKILKGESKIGGSIAEESVVREKLCRKRILVVLDNVLNYVDAESLLGGFDWFGPGSLIIITSREKQVLDQCRVNGIYEARGLNENEALRLFSRRAFDRDEPEDDFLEVSKKVIEHADRNPKAIHFYGKELKNKKPTEMETLFLKLKQIPVDQIPDV